MSGSRRGSPTGQVSGSPGFAADPAEKVFSRERLLARFGRRSREGTVVFTNGCFDLLHAGHVEYLCAARRLGDFLVVGVNSDESVSRLKGAGRPLVPESDRATVLAALACVDAVTVFGEDTPLELIGELQPDVLVKGADYRPEDVVGREEVEGGGGRLVLLPYREGYSTTELVRRIREDS